VITLPDHYAVNPSEDFRVLVKTLFKSPLVSFE